MITQNVDAIIVNEKPRSDPEALTGYTGQTVSSVERSDNWTRIHLANGKTLHIQPYIYLREGDVVDVFYDSSNLSAVWKHIRFAPAGCPLRVRIYPPYSRTEIVHIPPHTLRVTIRERTSARDWRGAKLLEQFHYRGQGLNKIVGRRTALLMEAEGHGIIGYGVLSGTVAVAKPRFLLFETDFAKQMKTKLINQLVRIPRVVIHPEFRGLGLGALMARHLIAYAAEYWDINGYRPIMVEVIASMTHYHRFFQQAGFIEAGQTMGQNSAVKPNYGNGSFEPRLNHKAYRFFSDEKPRPYLVYPLSEEAMNLLKKNGLVKPRRKRLKGYTPHLENPLRFSGVSVTYKVNNGLTPRAKEVKETFGVESEQMHSPVLIDFSLTINPGDVVLFTGASGSGKSTIIKLLTMSAEEITTTMDIDGNIQGMERALFAKLDTSCDESAPLIEQVGASTEDAIAILNSVGLAEAHLYLKRCPQISEGQRYRFAVAKLCDSKKSIWIADEFASTLDPQTAAIVAKGIRKLSWQQGATLLLAAPHIEHFVESLLPNKLVYLRWGGMAKIYATKLCRRFRSHHVELWVKNIGREVLSGVVVSSVNDIGGREELLKADHLTPDESSGKIVLDISKVQSYAGIVLRSKEGAGDIMRLENIFSSINTGAKSKGKAS